jgi:hypothetical protein
MSGDAETEAVVLAASYPPREYAFKADSHEIAAAVKALVGAVFQQRWHIVFGGHPAISPLILMIAREYGYKDRVTIYQSRYFLHHISPAASSLTNEHFGELEFVPNDPGELPPGPNNSVDPAKCPKSLTAMRTKMISHPGVRGLVLVGGDTGLREELELFRKLRPSLPVVPLGAPGGIARELLGEASLPGISPELWHGLHESRNYLLLATRIVRYIAAHR